MASKYWKFNHGVWQTSNFWMRGIEFQDIFRSAFVCLSSDTKTLTTAATTAAESKNVLKPFWSYYSQACLAVIFSDTNWTRQIMTKHAHVSRRPCLLHNNHQRYARQNFYLWARSSAVFDVLILWNMASKCWKSMIKTNKMDIILREKKLNNQSFVVFPVQKDHSCSACQSCAL